MAGPITEAEARARLRLLELEEEELALASAAAPVSDAPSVNVEGEGLDLQDVRGFGGALLKGQLMGYGDEFIGGARTLIDKILPETEADRIAREEFGGKEQSLADSYKMYRDDARESDTEFERENAGTALAANLVGGIASPINKVAPGFGASTARGMAARGAAEGALAGYGESTEGNVGRSMLTGAGFGGGMGGLLGVGKNVLGRNANIEDMGGTSLLRGANRFVRRKLGQEVADAPTFKPLNLAADDETLLGRGYRNTFGRSSGGGKLRKQETPWLVDAAEEVEAERTALNARKLDTDEAARLEKLDLDYSAGQERQGLAENVRQERLNMDTHVDALEAAELKPKTNVPKLPKAVKAAGIDARTAEPTVKFRRAAATESVPMRERDLILGDVDIDDTEMVDDLIYDFWQSDDAFRMVKDAEFDLDDQELRGYLKEVMETPESRSQLGEVVTAAKKRAKAEGELLIKEIPEEGDPFMRKRTDDELLQWAFEGSIDGGVLMELRNIYARGANNASGMSRGAQRKVASAFDKYIVRNIDDADEYFEHIEAYPNSIAHGKAVAGNKANAAGGRFTIDEHQAAGKSMARRGTDKPGKRSRKRPMQPQAREGRAALEALEPPPSALPDATAANAARQANEAADASNAALKGETKRLRRTLKSQLADRTGQRSGDIKTRAAEAAEELTNRAKRGKAELNEEAITGPLGQASARARELAAKSTPKGASGLSERLTDVMIGSAITPRDTSFLGKLGSGIMGATQGTTQVVQKNLAGQGDLQKGAQAMARALRATPEFLGMTREEQILEMIARGMSRQAALQAVGD